MGFKVNLLFMRFSAGVGRSGTFVTLLWLMQLCVRGIRPDVRAAVEDLRLHRMWMVQNLVSPVLTLTCSDGGTTDIFYFRIKHQQKNSFTSKMSMSISSRMHVKSPRGKFSSIVMDPTGFVATPAPLHL